MERQLDPRAALLLKRAIEAKNIEVLLGADTKGFWAKIALQHSSFPAGGSFLLISWSARLA